MDGPFEHDIRRDGDDYLLFFAQYRILYWNARDALGVGDGGRSVEARWQLVTRVVRVDATQQEKCRDKIRRELEAELSRLRGGVGGGRGMTPTNIQADVTENKRFCR